MDLSNKNKLLENATALGEDLKFFQLSDVDDSEECRSKLYELVRTGVLDSPVIKGILKLANSSQKNFLYHII